MAGAHCDGWGVPGAVASAHGRCVSLHEPDRCSPPSISDSRVWAPDQLQPALHQAGRGSRRPARPGPAPPRCARGWPGRNEQRGVPDRLTDTADVGGDHGKPRGEGLVEDLRQALGPGDMGQRVRLAVCLGKSGVVRRRSRAARRHRDSPSSSSRRSSAPRRPPSPQTTSRQRSSSRRRAAITSAKRKRVLLGLEPADAERDELPASSRAVDPGRIDVRCSDQRDGDLEERAGRRSMPCQGRARRRSSAIAGRGA